MNIANDRYGFRTAVAAVDSRITRPLNRLDAVKFRLLAYWLVVSLTSVLAWHFISVIKNPRFSKLIMPITTLTINALALIYKSDDIFEAFSTAWKKNQSQILRELVIVLAILCIALFLVIHGHPAIAPGVLSLI